MEDNRTALQVLNDVIRLSGMAYQVFGMESEKGIKVRQLLDVVTKQCLDISSKEYTNKEVMAVMKAKMLEKMKND